MTDKTPDQIDQEQMQKEAEVTFSALQKNFTPRAIAILKASMECSNSVVNDFILVGKSFDIQIERMVEDTGDANLTIPALMLVLGVKIEKLLQILMVASAKSPKIKEALEKQGIVSMNKENAVN